MENNSKTTPSAEELLTRIQDLEARHAHIKNEISKLIIVSSAQKPDHQMSNSASSSHLRPIAAAASSFQKVNMKPRRRVMEPLTMKLTEIQYLNIIHSMGQAMHIFDLKRRIYFWNPIAEKIYGLTSAEVFGKTPIEILVDPKDAAFADYLLDRTINGESWSGEFPVTNRRGEKFVLICTNVPFHDENRRLIGGICVFSNSRMYQNINSGLSIGPPTRNDSRQSLKTSVVSKISNLASKVKLKMKIDLQGGSEDAAFDHSEDALQSEASTPRGHFGVSPFGLSNSIGTEEYFNGRFTINSDEQRENKPGISNKLLSSKAGEWMRKQRSVWPWKETEREVVSLNDKLGYFGWQRLSVNQGYEDEPQISSAKQLDRQLCEETTNKVEASGLWLSKACVNSKTNTGSSNSTKSNAIIKVEKETVSMDYEILWEDLITKEQIGQGSCGTVYRGLWHGSDVAIKIFMYQEFSDDMMVSFKQEVSLMKRLRHPNIMLFMGAVTSPPRLCIVTEFLPRGSLYQILQRNSTRLDWRRRIHMAMDIARGMNYLHRYKPPIVHRDLKSSNLLVDRNWSVKVGDFGLSRIKYETYLKTKSGKGTPQWMAPEIIRSEQADEKSDVYSYGVVLWEIITEKIPWDDLNPIQVIAAVGFMNRRLEIPEDVDPLWASLIESCWHSEAQSRPTFQEILYKLKNLQKKYAIELMR